MLAAEATKQRKRAEAAQQRAEQARTAASDPALAPPPQHVSSGANSGGNGALDGLAMTGTAGTAPPGPPWQLGVGPVVRLQERLPATRMLTAILVLWVASIASGLMLHTGVLYGHKPPAGVSLPLLWFDRLLRHYGALLPLPILALRAAAVLLTPGARAQGAPARAHGGANPSAGAGAAAGDPASWLWQRREFGEALVVYAGVTVVRWSVYGLHQAGVFWIMWRAGVVSAAPVQLMSDHVFLGSSLAAVLGAEAVLIRLHIARRSGAAAPHLHPAEHPLLWAGLLICTVLLLLVCGDMHFTARFFHMPTESFWGAISGLGILQLPICWWLLRGFSTPAPHAAQ